MGLFMELYSVFPIYWPSIRCLFHCLPFSHLYIILLLFFFFNSLIKLLFLLQSTFLCQIFLVSACFKGGGQEAILKTLSRLLKKKNGCMYYRQVILSVWIGRSENWLKQLWKLTSHLNTNVTFGLNSASLNTAHSTYVAWYEEKPTCTKEDLPHFIGRDIIVLLFKPSSIFYCSAFKLGQHILGSAGDDIKV